MSGSQGTRDAEARRCAQGEFSKPLLVEAGAGTGKTATLVNRIVTWLLTRGWERAAACVEGDDRARTAARALEGTVAITFTDAAAAEMATRVEAGLAACAEDRLDALKGFDSSLLDLDAEERRRRARALIASLDRLVIRTIHAWCRRLLARYPVEAGLGADFDVDADSRVADRAAREVLEEELPAIYAEREMGPLALHLARQGIGPEALGEAMVALAASALPPEELASEGCDDEIVDGIRSALATPLGALLDAFDESGDRKSTLSDNTQATLDELGDIRHALAQPSDDASRWIAGVSAALRAVEKARERLRIWKGSGLQAQDAKKLDDASIVARINGAAPALRDALQGLSQLDHEGFETRRLMLKRLYPDMLERIRSEGYLTFGELLRGVKTLFDEHQDVLDEVRRGIDHLLVDEFQDTDALQCALVERIAFSGPVDDRPALFVVGDPKQSIYSWREADLAAYDAFKKKVVDERGEVHGLYVNFRSTAQILAEVSASLRPLMIEEPGIQPAFQQLVPGREDPEGERVEHWVSWDDDADKGREATLSDVASTLEAAAIAREIRARHAAGASFGKMAILLRSTSKLEIVLDALREAEVPYVVTRDRSYYRRREIIDAAAFVRAILDPGDLVAILAWLRSSTVGAPDASLPFLWKAGLPAALTGLGRDEDALRAAREAIDTARAQLEPLDQAALGLDRVPLWASMLHAGVETMAALRVSFAGDPADLFVEKLRRISMLEGAEAGRYLAPFRVANLERFFGELSSKLDESRGNAQELLRGLKRAVSASLDAEEARPETLTAEAVNVLTIHRSKGLDFDEVFVPQLHRGSGSRGGDRKSAAKERDGRWEITLLGKPSPRSFLNRERDARIAAAEQVRLLYVAMTRARERLVMAGRWLAPRADGAMIEHLRRREEGLPDLGALFDVALEGETTFFDQAGVRWRFPRAELGAAGIPREGGATKTALASAALLDGAARLAGQRALARDAQGTRASLAISALSHESYRDDRDRSIDASGEEVEADEGAPPSIVPGGDLQDPGLPRLAGSIVHRVLERIDLALPFEGSLAAAIAIGPVHAVGVGEAELREAAWELAREILIETNEGPLGVKFDAIRGQVLARELAVLVRPVLLGAEGADYASGVIDLVYRDPSGDRVVVADYKTDSIGKEEAVERYGPQLKSYALALRDAWGLRETPRRELWLLRAGEVAPCPD